jgi:hypothetical protein
MYNTLSEAKNYFESRLNTDAWDDANDEKRTKALSMAARSIDSLNYIGDRVRSAEFPRGEDTEVPDTVKYAECEIALALLNDMDIDLEIETLNTRSTQFGDMSMVSDVSFVPEHLANGIVSAIAWQFLKPYLRDPRTIVFNRVS